jgi:putative nucleotidyltransferase with HDIG domain
MVFLVTMKLTAKGDELFRLFFIALILCLIYLGILIPSGFIESARLHSSDLYTQWSSALLAAPAETKEIVLVLVDEESQAKLGKKWPWDRGLFAELIQKIGPANPKLIVLDFVMHGASADPAQDAALAGAIRQGPPVLLGGYMDKHGDPVLPLPLFTEAGGIPGMINKLKDRDSVVRKMLYAGRIPNQAQPLYATEINAAALARGVNLAQITAEPGRPWIKIGPQKIPIDRLHGEIPIHYYVTADHLETVSFWKVLQDKTDLNRFKGKLIFVGSTQEATKDVYPTPLGSQPGILVNINALLTILTAKFTQLPSLLWTFPLAVMMVFGILAATAQAPIWVGLLAAIGSILVGTAAGFLALAFLNIRAESVSVALLAIGAFGAGILYKYLKLVQEALHLHKQAVTDPMSRTLTGRFFRLRMDSAYPPKSWARKPITAVVFQIDRPTELLLKLSWQEVQQRVLNAVAGIRELFGGSHALLMGRISDERFAVVVPGLKSGGVGAWLKTFESKLTILKEKYGYLIAVGIASSDQPETATIYELLRHAEIAASRSWDKTTHRPVQYDPVQDKELLAPAAKTGLISVTPVSSQTTPGEKTEGLDDVASELEERNRSIESALENLRKAHKELEAHFLEVTKSLVMAMDTKDSYTAGHLERVSRYAMRLAEELGMKPTETEAVREAALLHDIGKMNLPDEVLHKTGLLTEDEKEIIKRHLEYGAKILDPMNFFKPITTILYHHHERYDGRGYPHGLTGEFIPTGAQVITIVDSFDAMTTNRGYAKPKTVQEAVEELARGQGGQFNPNYVDAFIEMIRKEGSHLASYSQHTP